MNGFEDLEVWKKGCRLTVEIYRAFFQCKDYGFKDQVQRSALSVPSNIAEGYERNSPQDFIRFLNIAKGSPINCTLAKHSIFWKDFFAVKKDGGAKKSVQHH